MMTAPFFHAMALPLVLGAPDRGYEYGHRYTEDARKLGIRITWVHDGIDIWGFPYIVDDQWFIMVING